MNCTPNPQVLSPCADDTVPVSQVLGTSGDVNFDESGFLALTVGQTEAEVRFAYQKESKDYEFERLYVSEKGAETPSVIGVVVKEQATKFFSVSFSGAPVSSLCTLHWRVVVPDQLRTCSGLTSQPQYVILPDFVEGEVVLEAGESGYNIVFPKPLSDKWAFDRLYIEHVIPTLPNPLSAFEMCVYGRTTTGCKIALTSAPTESGYVLKYKASEPSEE